MKRIRPLGCALGWLLFAASALAAEYHVSPNGSDRNPGTARRPWATLIGARDGLRQLRAAHRMPPGGVTVWVHGGFFEQSRTAEFFSQDSGAPGSPVTFAAAAGESVEFSGAVRVWPRWFRIADPADPDWARFAPAARGRVDVADLKAHGVRSWGELRPRGFSLRALAPLEFEFDHAPMTLARWPNADQPLARTGAVFSPVSFRLRDDRAGRWAHASDAWLHGFWSQDWADYHLPLGSVEEPGRLTLAAAPDQFGLAQGRPFYVYNLLEELDSPGEYYLDRSNGRLYFWPPRSLEGAEMEVSQLDGPLIAVTDARNLSFRGFKLQAGRGGLVLVSGGDHVRFERCVLRGAGQFGAAISGTDNGIDQSEILDCGEEGIRLGGGDRAALTPGNNYVTNCRIARTGRIAWAYKPAISFEGGCGNRAEHNLIEDLPHVAILFSGNNHLIAYNEIRRVCRLTGDAGAIYAGRSWGFRGNRIEFNYLHDIASTLGHRDVNGVYLDDCMSGVKVFANIFSDISGTAIFCGGGRDNLISNNLIARCGVAHYNDDRGRRQITAKPGDPWNLLESLGAEQVAYQRPPWSSAYPACALIPNSPQLVASGRWRNPEHSTFDRNAGWQNGRWMKEEDDSKTGVFAVYDSVADNQPEIAPLFDPAGPRPERLVAPVPGFVPIPFGAIGVQRVELR